MNTTKVADPCGSPLTKELGPLPPPTCGAAVLPGDGFRPARTVWTAYSAADMLAFRAVGVAEERERYAALMECQHTWNPLTDDGDAFRLVVKLEIDICFGANYVIADGVQQPTVNNANDPCAAVRYAIVRAAAELAA